MSDLKYWLWLSDARVSSRSKALMLSHYGDAESAFFAPKGEFRRIKHINPADAAILEKRETEKIPAIIEQCRVEGIDIITLQDAAYPKRLKYIYAPPPVIYVKGKLPAFDQIPAIAVIGTRKASPYGIKTAGDIAYDIVKCGGAIISLINSRVDVAAARGAMLAGGCCIGVLGTAHSMETSSVSKEVAERGALVSEYAPKTPSQNRFFRERNRIAAGLSAGVVVVEAPEKSNTALFVEEATEQGKELFAIPGNVDSANSVGTNTMLKDGAKPVTDGWDVMCEFEAVYPNLSKRTEHKKPEENPHIVSESVVRPVKDKKVIDRAGDRGYIDLQGQLSRLSEDQLQIVTALGRESKHIDDIIEETGMSTAKVLAQLTVLEIKGFVRREPGHRISMNIAKK